MVLIELEVALMLYVRFKLVSYTRKTPGILSRKGQLIVSILSRRSLNYTSYNFLFRKKKLRQKFSHVAWHLIW